MRADRQNFDIEKCKHQMYQMVYKLYNLTSEEISIVEGVLKERNN